MALCFWYSVLGSTQIRGTSPFPVTLSFDQMGHQPTTVIQVTHKLLLWGFFSYWKLRLNLQISPTGLAVLWALAGIICSWFAPKWLALGTCSKFYYFRERQKVFWPWYFFAGSRVAPLGKFNCDLCVMHLWSPHLKFHYNCPVQKNFNRFS